MMPTITSFLPTLPILPCDLETLGHLQQKIGNYIVALILFLFADLLLLKSHPSPFST